MKVDNVKVKRFFVKTLMIIIVLAIGFGLCFVFDKLTGPKDLQLVPGWQLVQVNGIVPKGAVLIVSSASETILPNQNPETKQATGYINQGRVNFYKKTWVITKIKVWAYLPSNDYDFLVKKSDFVTQCQQKLSELTEKKGILIDEYDVGHQ